MTSQLHFLDLFAGAGGLSEGFIQAGYKPVAHIESDQAACFTLLTRMAYHWLIANRKETIYASYLRGEISRTELYSHIPNYIKQSVINKEISQDSLSEIFITIDTLLENNSLDLIIGGPPCQAYSLVGRSRDKNRMLGDKRNYLYIFYVEFLKRYQPRYFLFENVIGLLSAKDESGKSYFVRMCELFESIGYKVEYRILNAHDYGVPQIRKRIILVGKRGNIDNFYPEIKQHHNNFLIKEMLCDLPEINAGDGSINICKLKDYSGNWLYEVGVKNDIFPVTWHIARPLNIRDAEIYKIAINLWEDGRKRLKYDYLPEHLKTHKNRSVFKDRFKVLAADLSASHTILAHLAKDGHYYIHPDINQNRSISPREAARLQTFPDDYYFEGRTNRPSYTTAFRQIGNAVPVMLARKIAEKLKENWYV